MWVVDGSYIRGHIDEEFTNFGQHYSFLYIPKNELWIEQETKTDEISPIKPDSDSVITSAAHIAEAGDGCAPEAAVAYSEMRSYDAGKAGDCGNKTLPMRRKKR